MFQVSSVDITSSFSKTKTNVNFKRITIIIGPNNSGKSILLKDIEEYFDIQNPCFKIFENLEISISQNVDEYEKFVKDILEFEDKQIRIFIDDEFWFFDKWMKLAIIIVDLLIENVVILGTIFVLE